MDKLFLSLGVNWRLFAAQGLNFLILLAALTLFVWRPLLKLLEERRRKIELGVRLGEEAERKLSQIEELKKNALAASEIRALELMKNAEKEARERGGEILAAARVRGEALVDEAASQAERSRAEALEKLSGEAEGLLKKALIRMVELDPGEIDSKLLAKAAGEIETQMRK